jgi:hypothetical protein
VIVGQLLYGWAARGYEGRNKQQIIAATGLLGDRSQPATHTALRYCYRPPRDSFGWARHGGVDVVFRRTLTGLDGAGRPGAFLVQVLVSKPGTLAPTTLGGLWQAGVWLQGPLDSPPTALSAIDSLAQLELRPLPLPDREQLETALAGYLANLCDGQRSAIVGGESHSAAIATGIADALPAELGLPGFSTGEDGDRTELYDLIGAQPGGASAAPRVDREVEDLWIDAARTLLDAGGGDPAAHGVIAATLERSTDAGEFAERLYGWLALERASTSGAAAYAEALADAAQERRLAQHLVESGAARRVCASIVEGSEDALRVLARTIESRSQELLVDLLAKAIGEGSPNDGVAALERVSSVTAPIARAIGRRAIASWSQRGELPSLGRPGALALIRVLAEDGRPPDAVAEPLVSNPELADSIVGAEDLPASWRATAAGRNPDAVSPATMGRALSQGPEFASQLLAAGGSAALTTIPAVLDATDIRSALRIVAQLERGAKPGIAEAWRLRVLSRQPAWERQPTLEQLSSSRPRSEAYAEAVLDTHLELVEDSLSSARPLPSSPRLHGKRRGTRVRAWERFFEELSRLSRDDWHPAGSIERVRSMPSTRETDVALELLVDSLSSQAPSELRWHSAVSDTCEALRLTSDDIAPRLVRAALRRPTSGARRAVAWTVCWIGHELELGKIRPQLLDSGDVKRLGLELDSADQIEAVRNCAKRSSDKRARSWLKEMANSGERAHRGRRRFRRKKAPW